MYHFVYHVKNEPLINALNNKGPRYDPCGTQTFASRQVPEKQSTLTLSLHSDWGITEVWIKEGLDNRTTIV